MSLFMDAILTDLAMPVGTTVGAGLIAFAALALGWRRTAVGLLAFAVVWLWAWSTPFVAYVINQSLSSRYVFQPAEALPSADAIVMLGSRYLPNRRAPSHPDLDATVDRIWHAARLYQAGKAPIIIVSGGFRGGRRGPGRLQPADAARVLLLSLGVPESAILTEKRSRTTRQNALYTAEIAAERGLRQVLLTTSAWHMPRAEATFRQLKLAVVPAATDYLPAYPLPISRLLRITSFVPNAGALSVSSRSLREYLGLLVYRMRGWA